jgi:hypothetical protein
MSPDMAAISLISPTSARFATAGVTSGAATSPTITKTASRQPMSRRRFMTDYHTGRGAWKGRSVHIVAIAKRARIYLEYKWLACCPGASADIFRADKVHKGFMYAPTSQHFPPTPCASSLRTCPGTPAQNWITARGGRPFKVVTKQVGGTHV